MNKLEEDIYREIETTAYVSFAELSRKIPGFNGECDYCSEDFPNLIFWAGMSGEAIDALENLKRDKKIEAELADFMVYLIDGGSLRLPIWKPRQKVFRKPTWMPLTFSPYGTREKLKNVRPRKFG